MTINPRKRPELTHGHTTKVKTGCGNIYVTVNRDEQGFLECFGTLGKTGGCASAQLEGLCRMISVAMRCDVDVEKLVEHLKGIRCASPSWDGEVEITSCADAIGKVLEKEIKKKEVQK